MPGSTVFWVVVPPAALVAVVVVSLFTRPPEEVDFS